VGTVILSEAKDLMPIASVDEVPSCAQDDKKQVARHSDHDCLVEADDSIAGSPMSSGASLRCEKTPKTKLIDQTLVIDLFKHIGYIVFAATLRASALCIVYPIPSRAPAPRQLIRLPAKIRLRNLRNHPKSAATPNPLGVASRGQQEKAGGNLGNLRHR